MTVSANSMSGYLETAPRISRSGVFVGLGLAALALVVSAPAVDPFRRPNEVEAMVSILAWWSAMLFFVWLAFSLAVWIVVLGRPQLAVSGWVRIITLPGARRLAEGLLAVSVLAGASSCAPGANEITAPRIEVLRPAEPGVAPTTLADTARLDTMDLDTMDLDTMDLGSQSTTTLAGIGSLDDARAVVDTATLGSDPVEPLAAAGADPFSPGGNALAPSSSPAVTTSPVDAPAPAMAVAVKYVIVDGDNFWAIACARVGAHLGRDATDAETTSYWVSLVKANTETIQTGNPDLVFPGEVITLPPIT